MRRAVFAPTPGIRVTSTSVAGNFSLSLAAAGIWPSSSSATIFVCRVSPIPASSVARPSAASSATECGQSRTTRAASL